VGTKNEATGCELWHYDGSNWVQYASGGFGNPNNIMAASSAGFEGSPYIGTANEVTGTEVWKFDGTNWVQVNTDGFGDVNNVHT